MSSNTQCPHSETKMWAQPSSVPGLKGVPKGTVIGILIFLLFISALPFQISDDNSRVCLFSDDTSPYLKAGPNSNKLQIPVRTCYLIGMRTIIFY